jgi:hypothetical protein
MKRFWQFFAVLTLCFVGLSVGSPSTVPVVSAGNILNFRNHYPGTYAGADPNTWPSFPVNYLEGTNFNIGPNARSVYWYRTYEGSWGMTYRMFNWGPTDPLRQCHYDVKIWMATQNDNSLRYTDTIDACKVMDGSGGKAWRIMYGSGHPETGLQILPGSNWDDATEWYRAGSSWARYYESSTIALDSGGTPYLTNPQLRCDGNNYWSARLHPGQVKLIDNPEPTPDVYAWHLTTTEETHWFSGPGSTTPGGCAAGHVTRWQQDYYFVDKLATAPGVTPAGRPGVARIVGGNLDGGEWFDVWFNRWEPFNPAWI